MQLRFSSSGPVCRGFNAQEQPSFSLIPKTTTTGASGNAGTIRDANVLSSTGQIVDSVFSVSLTSAAGLSFTNLTPSIATVSANDGAAVWKANGTAKVQFTHPVYGTGVLSYPVNRNVSGVTNIFQSWISASLAYAMQNPVDSAINGLTCQASTVDAFTSNDLHSAAVRNSSLWCASLVNLTAVPIGRKKNGASSYTTMFNGVAVSPRHVLCANHVILGVGDTLYFLGNDGNIQSAQVSATVSSINGTDLALAYLSAAITNITPMQVFPANTVTSGACALAAVIGSSSVQNFPYLPLLHWNQNQEILLLDFSYWGYASASNDARYGACTETVRQPWSKSPASGIVGVYSGDSGSPVFTCIPASTTPILIGTCHTTAGLPNVANNIAAVNAAMSSLGGGYSLTQANISGFPTY